MANDNTDILAAEPAVEDARTPDTPAAPGTQREYGASDITVLEGLEAVRKRPGMYIGSTGPRGLHHLVYEVVDNSVDEALAGYCTHIEVVLQADGGVKVVDDGRGIPVDMHPTEHKPTVEVVMTILHAGGKFGGGGYAVSGGLHGVGISVVNALSSRVDTEVRRQGHVWRMSFADGGKPQGSLVKGEETDRTGTTQTFYPDPAIFEVTEFDFETLRARYQRDEVYTNVGPILISVNPYKWNMGLYSESAMIHYHTHAKDTKQHLAPHLFHVRAHRSGRTALY